MTQMPEISLKVPLKDLCAEFRRDVVQTLYHKQTGHPGGSLSVCEILAVLLLQKMNVRPEEPDWSERDRLILSKGHAAPMLYRILAERGFFPVEECETLRDFGTRLQGHPCMTSTPGVDMTSGPLGLGLSAGLGLAMGLRMQGLQGRVYVVLGDGEIDEGTIWEGAMAAAKYNPGNLIVIVDQNGVQLDGRTKDIMPSDDLRAKFEAFGWKTMECDGHDVDALSKAVDEAQTITDKPVVILAHTVKGKGVSFMEGQSTWHGKPIDMAHYEQAITELGGVH